MNSILNYVDANDYFNYLANLDAIEDKATLLNEFYACHRLKKAITKKIDEVCRIVCNDFCPWLVDIDHEDITSYEHYLIRILLRFEMFVKKQRQHIIQLHDFYNPRPIRNIKPPEVFDATDVIQVYMDVIQAMRRLEKIVASFEGATDMWMYFLYNRRDIPETSKTKWERKSFCVINPDDSYDFKTQLLLVNNILETIIRVEMDCDISVFKDKRS